MRIVRVPIGWEGEEWVLVAGCQKADFPTEEERLLLNVGANHAAMMLQRKHAEEALRASEERVTRILESITDGMVTLDRQWRYTYINAQAAHHCVVGSRILQ